MPINNQFPITISFTLPIPFADNLPLKFVWQIYNCYAMLTFHCGKIMNAAIKNIFLVFTHTLYAAQVIFLDKT